MKTHAGVDLHQRFCYLTAMNASGKIFRQGQAVNEGEALRAWLRQLPGPRSYYQGLRQRKPAQVARIALARKLLTVVWALLHHGVCFDEELLIRG